MNSGKQSTNLQMTLREVNRVGEVKKNVPKLRFKGYEDSWEQRKLGTIITVHPSKDLIVEAVEDEGRSIVVQQGDSPILGYSNAEGFEGYINVTIFGDHTVSLYKPQLPFVVATDGVKILSSSILQHQYFYTVLEKYKPIPQGYKRHFSILKEQIANITVNKDEQKKIGEFFETIGDLITLHQRKYDALKSMKKTLLSKMFPKNGEDVPEIRFKGFTDAWEQRKLGSFADVTKLAGFEFTEHVVYSDSGKIIALRGLNVKEGKLVLNDVKYIDGSNFDKLNRSKLFKNDILFTYVGTVGDVAIIKENDRFYLAPNVARIRIQSNDSPIFVSHFMRNDNFYRQIILPLIATSSQPALSMENIRKFELYLPSSREEQDKSAELFENLDKEITLHQRKLDELKNMKKTLLQQMFV